MALKRMVRTYKRRTTHKRWSPAAMTQAVTTVLEGKMGYSLASRTFSLPKTTLERYVKKARACSALRREAQENLAATAEEVSADSDADPLSSVCIKYEVDYEDGAEWQYPSAESSKVVTTTTTINGNAATVTAPASSTVATYEAEADRVAHEVPPAISAPRTVQVPHREQHHGRMMCFGDPQFEEIIKNSSSPTYDHRQHHAYQNHQSLDAVDHLFLGFAKTIKTLSPKRQILTKMHIAQHIFEQELLDRDGEAGH